MRLKIEKVHVVVSYEVGNRLFGPNVVKDTLPEQTLPNTLEMHGNPSTSNFVQMYLGKISMEMMGTLMSRPVPHP